MHIMISPCHVMMAHGGGMAMSPLGSETSEDVEGEWERISKIRARPPVRNRLLLTAIAADGRASATREQEVSYRKVGHGSRHYPLHHGRRSTRRARRRAIHRRALAADVRLFSTISSADTREHLVGRGGRGPSPM